MKNIYKKLITILLTAIYLFSAVTPTFAAAQYLYDANGNMTSNGQNCYEYNDYNQLKKVKNCSDNKLIAEYGYNSEGQRQIKKEYDTNGNLKWTITSISDKFEVKEYPDGREEITKYYFVNDQLIAKKNPDGTKEYSHNDHLGSTNLTTDQSGQKIEETQYDPWGEVKAGGTKSKFQYTGQEKDPETGLNYYNARYYDSHTKHFTQPDDIVQDPYDPQTLNRYSYVKNNPLKYTDPSGHQAAAFFSNPWTTLLGGLIGVYYAVTHPKETKTAVTTGLGIANTLINQQLTAGSSVVNAAKSSKTTSNKPSGGGSSSNNGSKIPNGNNFDKISRILPFIPQNKDEKIFSGFTTVNKALGSAQTWLGDKYSEIAPNVFRSADNLRQFRMTSITGDLPHVNFESIGQNGKQIIESGHVYLLDMINMVYK